MKKLKSIVCVLMICATFLLSFLTFSPVANVGAISGDWSADVTEPDEVSNCFLISTPQELSWFNQHKNEEKYMHKNVKLMASIDLGAHYWTPSFSEAVAGKPYECNWGGMFDGNYHTISNLQIASSNNGIYAGLFAYTNYGTTIKNISFDRCRINGTHNASGVVVGYADGTTITNCFIKNLSAVNVTISGGWSSAGGLVGFAHASTISNCFADKFAVTATGSICKVGGIIGYSYNTNVSTCSVDIGYNDIKATGDTNYVGGIAGEVYNAEPDSNRDGYIAFDDTRYIVEKSFCINGTITAGVTDESAYSAAGGIVGLLQTGCDIENCYSKANVKAYAKDIDPDTYEWKDFDNIDVADVKICREYVSDGYNKALFITGGGTTGIKGDNKDKTDKFKSYKQKRENNAFVGGICGRAGNYSSIKYCYSKTGRKAGTLYGDLYSTGYSYNLYGYYYKIYEYTYYSPYYSTDYQYFNYPPRGFSARSKHVKYSHPIVGYADKYVTLSHLYSNITKPTETGITVEWACRWEEVGDSWFNNYFETKTGNGYVQLISKYENKQIVQRNIKPTDEYNNMKSATIESNISLIKRYGANTWAIDSKYNDGDPIIKDFYWEHSAVAPK